jgi:hypothetical protein
MAEAVLRFCRINSAGNTAPETATDQFAYVAGEAGWIGAKKKQFEKNPDFHLISPHLLQKMPEFTVSGIFHFKSELNGRFEIQKNIGFFGRSYDLTDGNIIAVGYFDQIYFRVLRIENALRPITAALQFGCLPDLFGCLLDLKETAGILDGNMQSVIRTVGNFRNGKNIGVTRIFERKCQRMRHRRRLAKLQISARFADFNRFDIADRKIGFRLNPFIRFRLKFFRYLKSAVCVDSNGS